MEFYTLVDGKKLPEVYHFSFNGTHFEIFVNPEYWVKYVEIAGEGTHYTSNLGTDHVPPTIEGGAFGQHGCAEAVNTLEGFVCIRIPTFIENPDDEEQVVSMRSFGHTLASVLFILNHLLHDENKKDENFHQGSLQLFVLETCVRDGAPYHGAGFDVSLSPRARKYLESKGDNIRIDGAVEAMAEHFQKGSREVRKLFLTAMDVHLRTNGVLHMHTVGNCACLGAMPKDFGEKGCYLSSHNVDTVFQQFNLLVGIACIWQMVRNGVQVK